MTEGEANRGPRREAFPVRAVELAGRGVGACSGAVVAVLWMVAMWVPAAGFAVTGISFVVALLMAMLALFAAIAAVRGHALVLVVLFVASFLPVGFALVGADHWVSWIGRLNLCYLLAAALIWLGRERLRE